MLTVQSCCYYNIDKSLQHCKIPKHYNYIHNCVYYNKDNFGLFHHNVLLYFALIDIVVLIISLQLIMNVGFYSRSTLLIVIVKSTDVQRIVLWKHITEICRSSIYFLGFMFYQRNAYSYV